MLDIRLEGLRVFNAKPMPTWSADLTDLDMDDIINYLEPNAKKCQIVGMMFLRI